MKFSGKVTKNQSFIFSLEDITILQFSGRGQIDPLTVLRLKLTKVQH